MEFHKMLFPLFKLVLITFGVKFPKSGCYKSMIWSVSAALIYLVLSHRIEWNFAFKILIVEWNWHSILVANIWQRLRHIDDFYQGQVQSLKNMSQFQSLFLFFYWFIYFIFLTFLLGLVCKDALNMNHFLLIILINNMQVLKCYVLYPDKLNIQL